MTTFSERRLLGHERIALLSEFYEKRNPTLLSSAKEFFSEAHPLAPGVFGFRAYNPSPRLLEEMLLEVREVTEVAQEKGSKKKQSYSVPIIEGECPFIDTEYLAQQGFADASLEAMLVIQFLINMLERLLLFCESQDAPTLRFSFQGVTEEYADVYRSFASHEDKRPTSQGIGVMLTIPTDTVTYDAVIDAQDKVKIKFQQMLWQDQKTNPIIRRYLKKYCLEQG